MSGDNETQNGDYYSENYLCSDVPHVQILHHEIQKDSVANKERNGHCDIQHELTTDHLCSLVLECPELLKYKV